MKPTQTVGELINALRLLDPDTPVTLDSNGASWGKPGGVNGYLLTLTGERNILLLTEPGSLDDALMSSYFVDTEDR